MTIHETRPYVAHHFFNVVDAEVTESGSPRYWRGEWTNASWVDDQVGVADGVVTVFSPRAAGKVPVRVEVLAGAPADDLGGWDHVVDASIDVRSGTLRVEGEANDESEPPLVLDVAPGVWRVRAYSGALATCEYDGDTGDDHYRIAVWPGEAIEPAVVVRFEPPDTW